MPDAFELLVLRIILQICLLTPASDDGDFYFRHDLFVSLSDCAMLAYSGNYICFAELQHEVWIRNSERCSD
jgi:hypothetical protein